MLNCRDATQLLSEAQERKLSLQERMTLQMHVMMCSGCRNFGTQMQVLRKMSRAFAQGRNENTSDRE